MTALTAPPSMSDLNSLVELMKLVSDPAAISASLQSLQEISAKIYADLVAQAVNADTQAAKDIALNDKEVSLNAREAGIAQREAALREAENALAAKVAALRNLVA